MVSSLERISPFYVEMERKPKILPRTQCDIKIQHLIIHISLFLPQENEIITHIFTIDLY